MILNYFTQFITCEHFDQWTDEHITILIYNW